MLYQIIVRVIKSRGVRWAGYVAHGRWEMHTEFWLVNMGRDHSEDLDMDGKLILEWS